MDATAHGRSTPPCFPPSTPAGSYNSGIVTFWGRPTRGHCGRTATDVTNCYCSSTSWGGDSTADSDLGVLIYTPGASPEPHPHDGGDPLKILVWRAKDQRCEEYDLPPMCLAACAGYDGSMFPTYAVTNDVDAITAHDIFLSGSGGSGAGGGIGYGDAQGAVAVNHVTCMPHAHFQSLNYGGGGGGGGFFGVPAAAAAALPPGALEVLLPDDNDGDRDGSDKKDRGIALTLFVNATGRPPADADVFTPPSYCPAHTVAAAAAACASRARGAGGDSA